jgi:hypothetical protein
MHDIPDNHSANRLLHSVEEVEETSVSIRLKRKLKGKCAKVSALVSFIIIAYNHFSYAHSKIVVVGLSVKEDRPITINSAEAMEKKSNVRDVDSESNADSYLNQDDLLSTLGDLDESLSEKEDGNQHKVVIDNSNAQFSNQREGDAVELAGSYGINNRITLTKSNDQSENESASSNKAQEVDQAKKDKPKNDDGQQPEVQGPKSVLIINQGAVFSHKSSGSNSRVVEASGSFQQGLDIRM